MAEDLLIGFTHKEVAEALVLRHGIHEGVWGIFVEFGIGAINFGPNSEDLLPAAVVPVLKIGLQRFPELNALSVDAAQVNPPARATVKAGATERPRGQKRA